MCIYVQQRSVMLNGIEWGKFMHYKKAEKCKGQLISRCSLGVFKSTKKIKIILGNSGLASKKRSNKKYTLIK